MYQNQRKPKGCLPAVSVRALGVVFLGILLSGCSSSLRPTDPDRTVARQAQSVQEGFILDIKTVTISQNRNGAQAAGAAVGGYSANRAVKNQGELTRIAATVGGAAVGAVAGNAVGAAVLDSNGVELIVQLDSGKIVSVVQQTDARAKLGIGDDVWVVGNNRSLRVLPKS